MSPMNIEPWIVKTRTEFLEKPLSRELDDPRDQFLGLVPAKTGPLWFHDLVPQVTGRCFWRGRIKFYEYGHEADGAGKFDSLVIYIGPSFWNFYNIFSPYGWAC